MDSQWLKPAEHWFKLAVRQPAGAAGLIRALGCSMGIETRGKRASPH